MVRVTSSIRSLGAILLIIGLGLRWNGGFNIPIYYRDFSVLLPVDWALLLGGIMFIVQPMMPLFVISAILPISQRTRLLKHLRELEKDTDLVEATNPETIASLIREFIQRTSRRYYLTITAIIVIGGVGVSTILPFLMIDLIGRADFRRYSNRLVRLVQETELSLGSADLFRQELLYGGSVIGTFERERTSTHIIHEIISTLYDPEVRSRQAFDVICDQAYERYIGSRTSSEAGLLPLEAMELPFDSNLEYLSAKISLLTLLASLAARQGYQGEHLVPYLQSRQLLQSALEIAEPGAALPATHNLLGVSYFGLLSSYEEYEADWRRLRRAINEEQLLSRLTLIRRADSEYELASESTSSSNLAAYINNRVDLRIYLLRAMHLEGKAFEPASRSDERFLVANAGSSGRSEDSWDPERLIEILNDLDNQLNDAVELQLWPSIFFTRAQLYSLALDLGNKYHFPDNRWSERLIIEERAVTALKIARSLGLDGYYFQPDEVSRFGLQSLWESENARIEIINLQ